MSSELCVRACLEVCIPTYKRPEGAIKAALSIVDQIAPSNEVNVIISIAEDHGLPGDFELIKESLKNYNNISLSNNKKNKGMSLNIHDMLKASRADYILMLTDDDWLSPGALTTISKLIQADDFDILYGPRNSYTEDGNLFTIATDTFKESKIISGSPLNCGRYSDNFFILSGLVIKSKKIDFDLWSKNIDNAFFPIIFGYSAFKSGRCIFYKESFVHHMVLNKCHWESWGSDNFAQNLRLAKDSFAALNILVDSNQPLLAKLACLIGTLPARVRHLINSVWFGAFTAKPANSTYLKKYLFIFISNTYNLLSLILLPIEILSNVKRMFVKYVLKRIDAS